MTGPHNHIGIIAGGGSLPGEIARSVMSRGGSVYVVMIEDAAEPALKAYRHTIVNWAELGHAIKAFDRAGVNKIVMVGRFARPSWLTAKPDFGFLRALPSVVKLLRAGGDDAVLRGVLRLFEKRRFEVLGVADVAPELLATEGALTMARPDMTDAGDIATGFALIAALGRHDIGQAAVVTRGVVEAIEGAEGTDRMLARVAGLRHAIGSTVRGGVLVKRPKPGQDMRVDLPAIGPDTVKHAHAAQLSGLAVMAGKVLAADRLALIEEADKNTVFVVGVEDAAQPAGAIAAGARSNAALDPVVLGAVRPDARASDMLTRGADIIAELAAFRTGSAVVLRDRRVLAVGASEVPREVVARAAALVRKRRRKRGIVVLGPREPLDEALVSAAAEARLEGILVMYGNVDRPRHSGPVLELADRLGLFVAAAAMPARERRHA